MTFAEAFAELKSLTGGGYFTLRVSATCHRAGAIEVEWDAYTPEQKFTKSHDNPDAVIAELRSKIAPPAELPNIDPVPEACSA